MTIKYTKDHEWISGPDEKGLYQVGISPFAIKELGDIVYLDIDTLDEHIDTNEVFGTIEAVKTVSDLFMPVGGTIVETNDDGLLDVPEELTLDTALDLWVVKVSLDLPHDESLLSVEGLMTEEEYSEKFPV